MKYSIVIQKFDNWNIRIMHKYGFVLMRYALAIIFIWFGILKPLGLSPAAGLVERTAYWFSPEWFLPVLGWWEVAIGVFLIFRPTVRVALLLLFFQMPGTFLPLILLPDIVYTAFPYGLTLEGQYIIKNLILIAAAIGVGGTIKSENTERELY